MPNIGPMEVGVVLIIALVIFGPKKLPDLGRGLGHGLREFKDSITGNDTDRPRELQQSVEATEPAAISPESDLRDTGTQL